MVAKNLLDDIIALPVEDRLEIFEALRKSLIDDPAFDPLTEDQKRMLDERLCEYESNPDGGSTWEEVEARLEGLLKDRT